MESYQRIADTVGLVPSLNAKDNLYQGIAVLVGALVGAIAGALMGRGDYTATLVGTLLGLVGSGLASGFVLMLAGWRRSR